MGRTFAALRDLERVALATLTGLVLLACWSCPAWPEGEDAEELADNLVSGQQAAQTQDASDRPRTKAEAEPAKVSLLDVGAKLALLVLVVYGVAWGMKTLQSQGIRLPHSIPPRETRRLSRVAEMALGGGAVLHVIEIDGRSVLVAKHAGGEVSLLMDLDEKGASVPPPKTADALLPPAPSYETSTSAIPVSLAHEQETDWATRRDALIRALSRAS